MPRGWEQCTQMLSLSRLRSLRFLRLSPWLVATVGGSWSDPSLAQQPTGSDNQASGVIASEEGSPRPSTKTSVPESLYVHIVIEDSPLQEQDIRSALEQEFRVPVLNATGQGGLSITVSKDVLVVGYVDEQGSKIERQVQLPQAPEQQLATIALLSGSLARDEAGVLLARLQVPEPPMPEPEAAPEAQASDTVQLTPEQAEARPQADGAAKGTSGASEKAEVPGQDDNKDEEDQNDSSTTTPRPPLSGATPFSVSFAGKLSYPPKLEELKTNVELGAVYSHIGALSGVAINLLVVNNRGLGPSGSRGAQAAIGASMSHGDFVGAIGSVGFSANWGNMRGALAAAGASYLKGNLHGAQAAVLGSYAHGNVVGVQAAALGAGVTGNLRGVQAGGAFALVDGEHEGVQIAMLGSVNWQQMRGVQAAALASFVRGEMNGYQMALSTTATDLEGMQFGIFNLTTHRMHGTQFGLINFGGTVQGTQVGLLNIGGNVKGNQIGLVNVAKDVDGVSFAPISIIPKIRNQLVTYASYSSGGKYEGLPVGPLYHVGLKFLPKHFYSQLSVGFGPEARECDAADACFGGGWVFAPAFAFGVRADWTKRFYSEFDVQYQFEKGFNQSRSSRHGVLGRVAAGFQMTPAVALFGGGGPRVDFREGPRVSPAPEVSAGGHAFLGLAFF